MDDAHDANADEPAAEDDPTVTTTDRSNASTGGSIPLSMTRRSALLGTAGLGLTGLGLGATNPVTATGGAGAPVPAIQAMSATVSLTGSHELGRGARSRHPGAVVIGDSTAAEIGSRGPNEVRSQSPIYAPSFNTTSTAAAKTDLEPVDPESILDGVSALPIHTWRFTDVDDGRHVGPMAEAFHATFDLDQRGDTIASVDADGIALAAIKGLLGRHEAERDRLQAEIADRHERIDELEARLAEIETEVAADDE